MTIKKRIVNADFVLTLGLALAFAGSLIQATKWPVEASLFPMVVGVSGLVLGVLEIGSQLRGQGKPEEAREEQPSPTIGFRRQEFRTFAWILGLLVATVLAGFQWGLPTVILLYYRLESKQRLVTSVVLAAVCGGVIYAWTTLLHLTLYDGLLSKLVPGI